MRWLLPSHRDVESASTSLEAGMPPLVARVLASRGLSTPEAAAQFMADSLADLPDPMLMKGMELASERLCAAIRRGEQIALYGDYDVDGVCSSALMKLFLQGVGAKVRSYIPHRLGEGYGLNREAVERLCAEGAQLLITLDCGITSVEEVALARGHGVDVLIVDHHTVPELLPPATAILNPHQPGCEYPTRHLCAAGVAFNLCIAARKRLRETGGFGDRREPNLRELMDLVALATVADVVPLTGANRVLVKQGLKELGEARRPGVRALKEVSGLSAHSPVTSGLVGFRLGPRINAAGRLDDASIGLRLLCSETFEEAVPLAQLLDAANAERQAIEQRMLNDAFAQAATRPEVRGLVLASEGWHPGVVGIVASRVVEKFHRPAVLVAMDGERGRGSARSIERFHLFDALSACSDHLARFGGHKHAAGLTVEAPRLADFTAAFERIAAERLCEDDLVPRCRVDAVVSAAELDERSVQALEMLGPFGCGNPEPVFVLRRQVAHPRLLRAKREGGANHLKLSLEMAPHLDAIGFGMGDRMELTEGPIDLAFQVSVDDWNGRRRVQLKLKDLAASA